MSLCPAHPSRKSSARTIGQLLFLALSIPLLSCDAPFRPDGPGRPAALQIVSGEAQEGVVGQELAEPLVVRVVDDNGQPVPGQLVNWVVTAGGGHVFAGAALTNAQGIAQERWTLGTSTEVENRLEVRAVDSETGERLVFARFTARGRPGPAATITKVSEDVTQAPAGHAVTPAPTVFVADQYGNAAEGATVTFTVAEGGGTATPTAVVAAADGRASTSWVLGPDSGTNTLSASIPGAPAVLFTTEAVADDTPPGTAAAMTIVTQPSLSTQSGEPFAQQPVLRLIDAQGNAVQQAGVAVSAALAQGAGTLGGTKTVTTDAEGVATFTNLAITGQDYRYVLSFASPGLPTVHSHEIAMRIPGQLTLVKVSGDNQRSIVGTRLEHPVVVQLLDDQGAPAAGVVVSTWVRTGGGTVQPEQATTNADGLASFAWTLGPGEGLNELMVWLNNVYPVVFSATGEAGTPPPEPTADIRILKPATSHASGTMPIEVEVISPTEIVSVSAAIGGRSTALTYSSLTRLWTGAISLDGLPHGEHELVIVATDISGMRSEARKTIVHDRHPTINVIAPLNETVARPNLHVHVTCTDAEGPCARVLVRENSTGRILAEGTTELNTEISLADWSGRVTLKFEVHDALGQKIDATRYVHVETSTYLREVAAMPGLVYDSDGARTLYGLQDESGLHQLWIHDRSTGASTHVSRNGGVTTSAEAKLTSRGAIFTVATQLSTGGYRIRGKVHEFADGALIEHGDMNSAQALVVAGNYALWMRESTLYRRDIDAGVTTAIGTAINSGNQLAANGDVVFTTTSAPYQIWRYRDGQTTPLTNYTSRSSSGPVTDGINVVYSQTADGQYSVMMNDGTQETRLSGPFTSPAPRSQAHYQANSGWIAYVKWGTSTGLQIWTRSPAGEHRLAAYSSALSLLGPNGEIIINRVLHEAPYTSSVQFLNAGGGRPYFVGDKLFYQLGRHVYEVIR